MTMPVHHRGGLGIVGAAFAGAVSAALFAVAFNHLNSPMLFPVFYIVPIPLFMAGLGAGALAGLISAVIGIAGLIATHTSNYAMIFTFGVALPVTAFSALALRYDVGKDGKTNWCSEGRLLAAMAVYPAILFLIACFAAWNYQDGLFGLTSQMVNTIVATFQQHIDTNNVDDVTQLGLNFIALIQKYIAFMPAFLGVLWLVVMMIDGLAGQISLQRQGWNLRPGFELKDITIPSWLVYLMILSAVAGCTLTEKFAYIGANVSILLCIPFFFSGLGVVHSWATSKKSVKTILILFYVLMVIMPLIAILVTLLGISDQWIHFRQQPSQKPKTA